MSTLMSMLGDPTKSLLPVATKELPAGSKLDTQYDFYATDPSGRRWYLSEGTQLWYMVDPNAVAR